MTRILRLASTLERRGATRSPFYREVQTGLMTRPVKIGTGRAVGWPEHEVEAITAARIGGASDEQIAALVRRLHEQRDAEVLRMLSPASAEAAQ
jgi:prophage regulatory protein